MPQQHQRKLQPIPPPDRPSKHIGMDLMDIPETPDGYKHMLITVCYLSKYVAARPLRPKTTNEVIRQLEDIYLDMGLPDIIQHDQGKEFTSKVFSFSRLYQFLQLRLVIVVKIFLGISGVHSEIRYSEPKYPCLSPDGERIGCGAQQTIESVSNT